MPIIKLTVGMRNDEKEAFAQMLLDYHSGEANSPENEDFMEFIDKLLNEAYLIGRSSG